MKKNLLSLCVSMLILVPVTRVSAGLVLHWNLDDGAGNTAKDSSGKGVDGTIGGTAQWMEGKVGGALMFDGKTNYIAVGNQIVAGTCSVALWIMPTGVPYTTDYQSIFHDDSWVTGAIHGHLRNTTSLVNLDVNGGGGVTSTTALQSNIWYHILATFDVATGESKLYINGAQENAATGVSSSLFLGPLNFGAWTKNSRFFPGAMDDVRIYDNVVLAEEIPAIMLGGQDLGLASGPAPKGGTTDVPRDTILSWKAGKYAASHDVYFGVLFDDVNTASRTAPQGVLASQDQTTATFDPAGLLAFGQTYYWRVDEVNAAPDSAIHKGSVWDFTTEPYGYPIKAVKATASSSMIATMGPDKTVDGSGLDALDQHGTSATQMWLSKKGVTPIWIQYEFDTAYKLYQMWVWNSNQQVESVVGFGAKDVTVETSLDGTTWTALTNVPEFADGTSEPNYVHNTTVDFGGIQAKFVKLTIHSNWADGTKQAGLSEVRFFYVPVKAFGATPANGGTDVAVGSVLNWRPGREAAKHEVYLSSDPNAVVQGTASIKTLTEHSLSLAPLGLDYGRTYYWKVNEVNDAASPQSWEGDLWSFTTIGYAVVDDFESYNDTCSRVFFAWVDGLGHNGSTECSVLPNSGNGTGSTVGNVNPPFAEQTIVHGGRQSMPMNFDNTKSPFYSEAQREWPTPQVWTGGGVNNLVVYLRGDAAAFIETSPGTIIMNGTGTDIWANGDQFRYAYKQLKGNGSITARVDSVAVTNAWSKAGVMIRESLDAGSTHATTVVSGSSGVSFQRRLVTADVSYNTDVTGLVAPYWVKITRNGSTFTSQSSADGVTWVDSTVTPAVSITMANDVYIGLAVSSHVAGVVCGAKFSSVSTTGSVSGQWQVAEIGATQLPGNTPEAFYVALQDNAGKVKVVSNADTSVIATGNWEQWTIPLSQFSSAGVNLGAIKKMVVGVGDRSSPKAGGAGKLYIDDIRLVRK